MSYLKDLLGDSYKDGMTEEEISAALEDAKIGKPKDDGEQITRLKAQLSKANSEAADYKKQLRAKQSDEDAQKAEQAELLNQLTEENKTLKRSMAVTETTAKLVGIGYDTKLATATATAMIDGKTDDVLKGMNTFFETQKKKLEATAVKSTPRPSTGSEGNDGMTLDKFRKMSQKERFKWANENTDEYRELYTENNESSDEGASAGGN